jgi:hypothetical protein
MANTYEGSGMRAAESNSAALQAAEAELRNLESALQSGTDMDGTMAKIKRIQERIRALKEDRGRIGEAGMV